MSASERQREIRRRRARKRKVTRMKRKVEKASVSEKTEMARKLRELTPGADVIIRKLDLEEVDR